MVSQYRESSASYSAPAFGSSRTTVRQREHARRTGQLHTPAVGIIAVWADALASFNTHSAAILLCACVCIVAPIVIIKGIDALAKLSVYAQDKSALALGAIYDAPAQSTVLIGAIAGVFGLTLARGVIMWMALHGSQPGKDGKMHGSLGQAIRTTITRFPALLAGTLLYGALLTSGIVGLNELTQHLEYKRDRSLHMWAGVSSAVGDGLHQFVWHGVNTLFPNPGPPFVELMPGLRHAVAFAPATAHTKTVRIEDAISAYGSSHTFEGTEHDASRVAVNPNWMTSTAFRVLAPGSVVLILLVETLLRFRTVMALIHGRNLLAPLIASARFGLRHFGRITIHVWVVRLAILALILVFVEFPLAITDHLGVPNALRFPIPLEIVPILDFLTTSGAALVSAILIAFSGVYDARLYHSLTNGYGKEQMFASGELPARNYA